MAKKKSGPHAGYCRWLRAHGFDDLADRIERDPPPPGFPHARVALAEYDRVDAPALRRAWEELFSNRVLAEPTVFDRKWDEYHAAELAAVEKVQEAFWKDTWWLNSRDHCRLVGTGDVRRLIAAEEGVKT